MTRIVQRRGVGVPKADQMETAELAVDTSNGDLYTKLSDGTVVQINGGSGSGDGGGAGILMSGTEPTDKTEGMMWMDTSASPALVWIWDGAAWVEFPFVGGGSDGSGGGSGPKLPELQYLLIGGGGNGGYAHQGTYALSDTRGMPGGGGAGGYRTNVPGDRSGGDTDPEVTPPGLLNIPAYSQFRIVVGEGGEARTAADWATMRQNGKPSAIQDVDGNPILQAEGGGGGACVYAGTASTCPPSLFGGDGASGGGGAGGSTSFALQNDRNGTGISGQGSDGKNRGTGANGNVAGGGAGGGAGGPAFAPDGTNSRDGMNGGPGLVSSIDGLNKERAGGGAGKGGRNDGVATHGGGQPNEGTDDYASSICNGEPHTGAGAGSYYNKKTGSGSSAMTNAPGGSGLVVIRYFGPQVCFGGEVTTHNGYTVHTFKSDGIFTVGSLT